MEENSKFYKNKLVLVTGGTGFVGSHIVQEFLKHDARIRIPMHNRPLLINDARIETLRADLTRQEDCLAAVRGVDYIFHAAGAVASAAVTSAGPMEAMEAITTNLVLTARILQAVWSTNVDRVLIFSSSTGYPVTGYPIKEEEMWSGPTHPIYFGYGWMRRYLERLGEFVHSKSNIKIAIVRPTAIYGKWDNFDPKTGHVIPALIRRAVEKENPFVVWGTGNEVRDFLHVSDLARACLLMLEKYATCDPINIGYGKGVTIKEVVKIILKAANHENADVKFDTSKPTTIPFRVVDTTKAKNLLGFEPLVSLDKGIKDTVEWFINTRTSDKEDI